MKQFAFLLVWIVSISASAEHISKYYCFSEFYTLRALSPNGQYVAVVADDPKGSIRVLDLTSGRFVLNLDVEGVTASMMFSPDSEQLLVGLASGFLERYEIRTGICDLQRLMTSGVPIASLAISVDSPQQLWLTTVESSSLSSYPNLTLQQSYSRNPDPLLAPHTEIPLSRFRFTSAILSDASYAVDSDASLGQVRLFDLRNQQEVGSLGTPVFLEYFSDQSHRSNGVSFKVPITPVRAVFSSIAPTIAILSRSENGDLKREEFNLKANRLHEIYTGQTAFVDPELHALSENNATAIVLPSISVPRRRADECAFWTRVPYHNQPQALAVKTLVLPYRAGLHGSVLISTDGNTALTFNSDLTLRIWSLP